MVQQFKPDVLVTSALALGPLIVGERAHIPVAVIGLLTGLLPEAGSRRGEFQGALDECRVRVGHPPVPVERMLGGLYLTRGVPELVAGQHHVGACSWEPSAPSVVVDWLRAAGQAGKRVVYVQQARSFSAPGFWPLLASALPSVSQIPLSDVLSLTLCGGRFPPLRREPSSPSTAIGR